MKNNETLRMTHNEYFEFLKKNAERMYTEKGYTMAHYNRDAERVEIIGFDLDRFGFDEKTRGFIDKVFSGDGEDKFGNLRLDGNVMDNALAFTIAGELGCELVKDKFYSGFFKNDEVRCVLEYCEGDVYLTLCETDERYQEAVEDYERFYGVRPQKAEVLFDELRDHLEENGWKIEPYSARDTEPVRDAGWEVSKETPAGEDFFFFIEHGNDLVRAVNGIEQFASGFDVEKHAQVNSAKWGAPNMATLIQDAKWIARQLDEVKLHCQNYDLGPYIERPSLDEQIQDAGVKAKLSEHLDREVCKVTFVDGQENRFDVYLDIVPEEYKGEKDGFLLTADERCLAYDKAAELFGDQALGDFTISTAEMVKTPVRREMDPLQER